MVGIQEHLAVFKTLELRCSVRRKMKFGFNFCGEVFPGVLEVPDHYFDANDKPISRLLRNRLDAQPFITWDDSKPVPKGDDDGRIYEQPH